VVRVAVAALAGGLGVPSRQPMCFGDDVDSLDASAAQVYCCSVRARAPGLTTAVQTENGYSRKVDIEGGEYGRTYDDAVFIAVLHYTNCLLSFFTTD
jgi:hypothetical protein